jgi:hypothetical protein
MKKSLLIGFVLIGVTNLSYAEYNANMTGVVKDVLTYTDEDKIFFRLENQPSSHPQCNPDFFSIDASIPADRRQAVLSRLLTALATGEPINIGFDKDGQCSHNRIRTHRVG